MGFKWKISNYLSVSREKGIITEEQKKAILNVVETETGGLGFFKILSIIGAICIWIWIILMISANWSGLWKTIQLFLALALPVFFIGFGYYFSYVIAFLLFHLFIIYLLMFVKWSVTGPKGHK